MAKEKTSNDDIRRLFPGEILTDFQIEFSRHYVDTGKGMKSVRLAGYALSTAGAQSAASNRLLKNWKIKKLVELIRKSEVV